MKPGEYLLEDGEIALNVGRQTVSVDVTNTGDRPVQVGSHFPFSEVNRALTFDRGAARGMRLDIPAGASVRFEPGESKEVQLVKSGGTGLAFKPYARVQFIAHVINTAPEIAGSVKVYKGLNPASADIAERVKFVGQVIESARTNSATRQGDASVLKVFMMPEFFFRGRTGAYEMDDVQVLIKNLQELVKDTAKWEHWLFVFGTIVGHSLEPTPLLPDVEAYNYALVQRGGFGDAAGAGPAAARAVIKEFLSGIDFIVKSESGGGIYLERVHHLEPLNPPGTRSEEQVTSYDGAAVFPLNSQIIVGLEICLDHAQKRLRVSLGLPDVDIQLIPSCGMDIVPKAVVTREKGYVFLCDGLTNSTRTQPYNSRVVKWPAVELSPAVEVNVNAPGVNVNNIFARGPGKLRIYPEQDLM